MSDATLIQPQRRSFATADPATARDFVDEVYGGPRMRLRGAPAADWRATLTEVTAGRLSACELWLPGKLAFEVNRGDGVVVETVLAGSVEITRGGKADTYARNDVFIGMRPDSALPSRSEDLRVRTMTLPAALLSEIDEEMSGSGRRLGRILAPAASDPEHARRWRELTRYVESLLADPEIGLSPLVLGPVERLLAATLLSFAGEGDEAEPVEAAHDAHPEALRRAIAFIEANPDRDISLGDIARAAYVSPRAVQLAFRRHLDSTPIRYLRQVRLDHARAQLEAAVDGDGTTVTSVALDWGFANPSRFSRHYRAAFGVAPSTTLRG
jgi:AraC-like DNA-binding protein